MELRSLTSAIKIPAEPPKAQVMRYVRHIQIIYLGSVTPGEIIVPGITFQNVNANVDTGVAGLVLLHCGTCLFCSSKP